MWSACKILILVGMVSEYFFQELHGCLTECYRLCLFLERLLLYFCWTEKTKAICYLNIFIINSGYCICCYWSGLIYLVFFPFLLLYPIPKVPVRSEESVSWLVLSKRDKKRVGKLMRLFHLLFCFTERFHSILGSGYRKNWHNLMNLALLSVLLSQLYRFL